MKSVGRTAVISQEDTTEAETGRKEGKEGGKKGGRKSKRRWLQSQPSILSSYVSVAILTSLYRSFDLIFSIMLQVGSRHVLHFLQEETEVQS